MTDVISLLKPAFGVKRLRNDQMEMTANQEIRGLVRSWRLPVEASTPLLNVVIASCSVNPCPNTTILTGGLFSAINELWGGAYDLDHSTANEDFPVTEAFVSVRVTRHSLNSRGARSGPPLFGLGHCRFSMEVGRPRSYLFHNKCKVSV